MTSAQEEFDELMRDKSHRDTHPEDELNAGAINTADDSDLDSDDPTQTNHIRRSNLRSIVSNEASAIPPPDAPRPSLSIPRTRYAANTGPKGVISDAQDFRDDKRRALQQRQSLALQDGMNGLSVRDHVGSEGKKFGVMEAEARVAARMEQRSVADEDDLEELDELDEEDDEFMQEWRLGRLRDLQNGSLRDLAAINGYHLANGAGKVKKYGHLTLVDGDGYLDAVDNTPAGTTVIVYISDDYSDVSSAIEECMRAIARKHQDTCFVKLHYEDAEMEPAGVPALIAYRDGKKFAALVPIIDEVPDDAELSANSIENVLQRRQVLR